MPQALRALCTAAGALLFPKLGAWEPRAHLQPLKIMRGRKEAATRLFWEAFGPQLSPTWDRTRCRRLWVAASVALQLGNSTVSGQKCAPSGRRCAAAARVWLLERRGIGCAGMGVSGQTRVGVQASPSWGQQAAAHGYMLPQAGRTCRSRRYSCSHARASSAPLTSGTIRGGSSARAARLASSSSARQAATEVTCLWLRQLPMGKLLLQGLQRGRGTSVEAVGRGHCCCSALILRPPGRPPPASRSVLSDLCRQPRLSAAAGWLFRASQGSSTVEGRFQGRSGKGPLARTRLGLQTSFQNDQDAPALYLV